MAIQRQQNWLSQQRVDLQHLRALESSVANDFDVLGLIATNKVPTIISGFNLVTTGVIGNAATSLVLQTAGGLILHYEASEAGSYLHVPEDRANEILSTVNPRMSGGFAPNAVNFVGIDFTRTADDSTADVVQFYNPDTGLETPYTVPLARTLDYVIVVSTTEFSGTPGICPLAKVTTDGANAILSITDARNLLFRLGSGGSNPQSVNPFGWPGGRDESSASLATVAGDRSLFSTKDWMNAIMTKLWEIGGGQYWYSLAADRNIRMTGNGNVFVNTSESFEWTGTNLHWQGLRFVFDNSNATLNEINDQLTDSAGLTNLSDGQCLYVDIDRSTTRTVAGVNALTAQKGTLQTLGGSATPGQRFVIAYRSGSNVYVRDQPFPVGGSFRQATTGATGAVRVTSMASGSWVPASIPVVPTVAMSPTGFYTATCGGISHNLDFGNTVNIPSGGDIVIGRGSVGGDNQILITSGTSFPINLQTTTDSAGCCTIIRGRSSYAAFGTLGISMKANGLGASGPYSAAGVLYVAAQREVSLGVTGTNDDELFSVEASGALRINTSLAQPFAGGYVSGGSLAYTRMYLKPTLFWRAPCRLSTAAALPAYTASGGPAVGRTLTANANGALSVDSVAVALNDRILVTAATAGGDNGIYVVTQVGSAGTPWILIRTTDNDDSAKCCNNMATRITAGTVRTGFNYKISTANPISPGVTSITFASLTSGTPGRSTTDSLVVQWFDGTETVLATSPAYTGGL